MSETKRKKDYLYSKLKHYLFGLIADHLSDPDFQMPTELELSEKFNISRVTVRRAYDELTEGGFVLRFKGRGTFVNPDCDSSAILAEDSVPEESFTDAKKIGVIVPALNSNHLAAIIQNICDFKNNRSDVILLFGVTEQSQQTEEKLLAQFVAQGVDGLILYPVDGEIYSKMLLKLSIENFPIVLVDRFLPGLDFDFVTSDNFRSIYDATRLLIENGHEKIILFSAGNPKISTIQERISGFKRAAEEFHLFPEEDMVIAEPGENNVKMIEKLKATIQRTGATAVLPICLTSSLLFLKVLTELDRDRAENLSYICFELDPSYDYIVKDLISNVSQHPERMGRKALELLLDSISNRQSHEKQVVKFPCDIRLGSTVKRIK